VLPPPGLSCGLLGLLPSCFPGLPDAVPSDGGGGNVELMSDAPNRHLPSLCRGDVAQGEAVLCGLEEGRILWLTSQES